MPLKRVTFIGNPDDPSDGRSQLEAFGVKYLLNRPRDVELSDSITKKLEGNKHFLVSDVPAGKTNKVSTPDPEPQNPATGSPEPGDGEPTEDGPTENPPPAAEDNGAPAAVPVVRERPRARR